MCSESKFIWMTFSNSDQPADFGAKSVFVHEMSTIADLCKSLGSDCQISEPTTTAADSNNDSKQ